MSPLKSIPTMNTFLCFLDLRRGCIIVGLISVILCVVDSSSLIYFMRHMTKEDNRHHIEGDPTMIFDFLAFTISLVGITSLSIILMIGAYKKEPTLVKVYVIGMIFCLSLMVIVTIMSFVVKQFSFWNDLIMFFIYAYCWFTAHSLQQKLESGDNLII